MTGLSFRAWMRAARKRSGITQVALGNRCLPTITAGRICDIERGIRLPSTTEATAILSVLENAPAAGGGRTP